VELKSKFILKQTLTCDQIAAKMIIGGAIYFYSWRVVICKAEEEGKFWDFESRK
jgi:hypothetical protein